MFVFNTQRPLGKRNFFAFASPSGHPNRPSGDHPLDPSKTSEMTAEEVFQTQRSLNFYGYELYEFDARREIKNIRDLFLNGHAINPEGAAFAIKDPRILGIKPKFSKKGRLQRHENYIPVSFTRALADIRGFGTALMRLPHRPRRIAILGEDRYEWYVAYLATTFGLGVVVPIEKDLKAEELRDLLIRSEADTLITTANKLDDLSVITDAPNLLHLIYTDDLKDAASLAKDKAYEVHSFWDLMEEGKGYYKEDKSFDDLVIDEHALGILLFTSGTVSKSKAVMLTQANITQDVFHVLHYVDIDCHDFLLSVLPLHHTYECTAGFLAPLSLGAGIAVCDGLRYISKNLMEIQPTIMIVVPLILEAFDKKIQKAIGANQRLSKTFHYVNRFSNFLLKHAVDTRRLFFRKILDQFGGKIRMIITGGAAINGDIVQRFNDYGIICLQGYGITEGSPIVAVNRRDYNKPSSVGLALPDTEIRIDKPDESGNGEIIVRGPTIMMGYYKDPEKTAEALDPDGFYHTGDLGHFDRQGFLHIVGRQANLIVTTNGKNIYAEELETLLLAYEEIEECVVFAHLSSKDKGKIEVWAEVFPSRAGLDQNPALQGKDLCGKEVRDRIEEIISEVNQGLVYYKHIVDFRLRPDEFEKNASHKIKRQNFILDKKHKK